MKKLIYVGSMAEVFVPFGAASFIFKQGEPKEVPDALHADLLTQPDKFEDGGESAPVTPPATATEKEN